MQSSIQPRKQRKALHQGPLHQRAKQIHAHLSEELLVKFGKRSTSVRVGDTVKVVRGKHAGTSGEVLTVDRRRFSITVEGVTTKKADGKEKPKPMHPSDVVLTKLDLSDKLRRQKLGASEADATPKKEKPVKAEASEAKPAQPTPAERAAAKRAAKAEEPAGADDDADEDLDEDEDEEEKA
ncbi:MAG TPA: 50S ribosomal protein L24 [Candidatus Thermoplasmatota archaeon]|jgi:large subunit ribosomal protein L24|nr:50S ribosomal protein L24 [Candidatus Thermoplasmatota archaeon]